MRNTPVPTLADSLHVEWETPHVQMSINLVLLVEFVQRARATRRLNAVSVSAGRWGAISECRNSAQR